MRQVTYFLVLMTVSVDCSTSISGHVQYSKLDNLEICCISLMLTFIISVEVLIHDQLLVDVIPQDFVGYIILLITVMHLNYSINQ